MLKGVNTGLCLSFTYKMTKDVNLVAYNGKRFDFVKKKVFKMKVEMGKNRHFTKLKASALNFSSKLQFDFSIKIMVMDINKV